MAIGTLIALLACITFAATVFIAKGGLSALGLENSPRASLTAADSTRTAEAATAASGTAAAISAAQTDLPEAATGGPSTTAPRITTTDILADVPAETPTPTASVTETHRPSETPASTNTPVAVADQDTAPGSVLEVGQEWVQNGMAMRLKSPPFAASCDGFLEFELTIQNNAGQELVVNINGNGFSLTDDQGRAYSNSDI
jgi:hypothetical protein